MPDPLRISRPAQIRAITSPVRQEVIDALSARGRATIAEIASELGRPADTLYYHLTALVRAGIVREVDRVRAGTRFAAVYDLAGRPVIVERGGAGGGAGDAAVVRVVAAALRLGQRDFRDALAHGIARTRSTETEQRNTWAGRSRGRIRASDLAKVQKHLDAIAALVRNGGDDPADQLVAFSYCFAPVAVPPARQKRGRTKKGSST